MIDSASKNRLEGHQEPLGHDFDIGTVNVAPPTKEDPTDGNLKSRKFIVSMTLIILASVFTGIDKLDIDMWMVFVSGVGAAYLGVNVYQKSRYQELV